MRKLIAYSSVLFLFACGDDTLQVESGTFDGSVGVQDAGGPTPDGNANVDASVLDAAIVDAAPVDAMVATTVFTGMDCGDLTPVTANFDGAALGDEGWWNWGSVSLSNGTANATFNSGANGESTGVGNSNAQTLSTHGIFSAEIGAVPAGAGSQIALQVEGDPDTNGGAKIELIIQEGQMILRHSDDGDLGTIAIDTTVSRYYAVHVTSTETTVGTSDDGGVTWTEHLTAAAALPASPDLVRAIFPLYQYQDVASPAVFTIDNVNTLCQ